MAIASLPKGSGEPRYMALARQLAKEIRKGKYPVDTLLPTEAELTTKYGLSRFTVREAIRQLQSQGLVFRRQGVGTRVLTEEPIHHFTEPEFGRGSSAVRRSIAAQGNGNDQGQS